jgi:hypothetical protein
MVKHNVQKSKALPRKAVVKENTKAWLTEDTKSKRAKRKTSGDHQQASQRSRSDNLREIRALVKKGAGRLNTFFYVGVVIGIVMGPLVLLGALVPGGPEFLQSPEGEPPFAIIFGGGMTVLFGIALVEQYVKHRKDNRILFIITHSPQEIVWIYKEISKGEVTSSYGTSGAQVAQFIHVHFHLTDGTHHRVWLSDTDANHLIDLLHTTFPHISCGYEPHILEAYQHNPVTLRWDPHYSDTPREVTGRTKI